jgi:hypothetical protein
MQEMCWRSSKSPFPTNSDMWMRLVHILYDRTCFYTIRLLVGSHDGAQLRSELPSPFLLSNERNQMVHAVQASAAEYLDAVVPG